MKKILALIIAALMLLSLAACGGSTGGDATRPDAADATTENTAADVTEAQQTSDAATTTAAPVENAALPGDLYQLDDPDTPAVLGLSLSGNRSGSTEFNARTVDFENIRCIFELSEWVEVTPDTDVEDGLAVWVFTHRENPDEYKDAQLTEETPGFAAYCELPFDPDAEPFTSRGSFYLNPDDCEAGFYDMVFTFEGKPAALLVTRFYNQGELEEKTDAELTEIMNGLR